MRCIFLLLFLSIGHFSFSQEVRRVWVHPSAPIWEVFYFKPTVEPIIKEKYTNCDYIYRSTCKEEGRILRYTLPSPFVFNNSFDMAKLNQLQDGTIIILTHKEYKDPCYVMINDPACSIYHVDLTSKVFLSQYMGRDEFFKKSPYKNVEKKYMVCKEKIAWNDVEDVNMWRKGAPNWNLYDMVNYKRKQDKEYLSFKVMAKGKEIPIDPSSINFTKLPKNRTLNFIVFYRYANITFKSSFKVSIVR